MGRSELSFMGEFACMTVPYLEGKEGEWQCRLSHEGHCCTEGTRDMLCNKAGTTQPDMCSNEITKTAKRSPYITPVTSHPRSIAKPL